MPWTQVSNIKGATGATGATGNPGATGPAGVAGPPGPASTVPGPPGQGVPAGGTVGQVLTKTSSGDYATTWQTPSGGGGGGGLTLPLTQNLTFSPDRFYNIGATAANRPNQVYVGSTVWVGDPNAQALQLTMGQVSSGVDLTLETFGGNLNLRPNSGSSVALFGNLIANTDNTYDIGASGANRPRTIYSAANIEAGGTVNAPYGNVVAGGNLYTYAGLYVNGTWLYSDGAANILAQRNGTNPQFFNIYNTYTDASNYERLAIGGNGTSYYITTQRSGASSPRILYVNAQASLALLTNDAGRWQIDNSGHFTAWTDNTYDIGASGANRPRNLYLGGNVTLNGSVMANATNGATAQPIIFHPSQNYGLRMWDSIVLAQTNTAAAIPGLTSPMGLLVVANLSTGQGALFWLGGGASFTVKLADSGSAFSNTVNNAGTVNVYWDGSKYTIQNMNATTFTLRSFFFQHI